ncbi:tissue factor pathway inhibitor-like isoform X1 [Sinocyclocheilus grahami]|uniref:tissue factor pathway inhibitor-like isoform X1 n=1 Tax=Sinocyclocheilus grahami TaxID=75366 RepID=UPI0007AD2B83|nr:PREDICTED: tissue factor pathway inhibitor-like isoform X1 [Sinocyclocheilus grahami]
MAPLLSWSCRPLLLLPLIGICFTQFAKADGVRSELHIFHHSCALKKDEGPCKAIKDRFYFDIDTGRCELFEYGGCQGNANNFETLQVCEEMCLVKEDKSPCHLEDEPGPCRGLVPRYYFDNKSKECKRFFYGGCFGNANNFKTIKECHERCLPASNHMEQNAPLKPEEEEAKPKTEPLIKHVEAPLNASHLPMQRMSQPSAQEPEFNPPEFCLSPVDRGDCDGSVRRYVYNPRTERCQMFRYSGCGGNKNNFVHKRHCMKMCMKDHSRRKQIRIKTKNSNILFRSV